MNQQQTNLTYFKKIVVPISKPATAPHMLELATALIDPEEGKVIAVTVSAEESEEETSARLEELQPLVERFENVELVTHVAGSITRGILDITREKGADALIIGMQHTHGREMKLGSIVENIIKAAPCDVLIYRASESAGYDHVVVPVDNNQLMPRALHLGALISRKREIPITPTIIRRDYTPSHEKQEAIRSTLSQVPEPLVQKQQTVEGSRPAESLLNRLDEDDLLILGFSQRADIDLEIGRNLTRVLLRRAPGPVLLSSQILEERGTMVGTFQRVLQYWNPAITQAERNELIWGAQKSALAGIDYSLLIMMSAALATFGLLLNSPAVIIGAMLVAPLMTPLGALAIGLASGELKISRHAILTLFQGVLLGLLISTVLGLSLNAENPTQEMLGRGSPSLLDAAVALASGLVAAFALARKEIPVALAGVAIAAALMPPLCTIGLGLAMGDLQLAGGATLLFIANITSIVLAENLVFLWVGLRPSKHIESRLGIIVWDVLIIGLLIVVVTWIFQLGQSARTRDLIHSYLVDQFPQGQVIDIQLRARDGERLGINATVRANGSINPVRVGELEAAISAYLEQPVSLEMTVFNLIQPTGETENAIRVYLSEHFPDSRVQSLDIRTAGDPEQIIAEVILMTPRTIQREEIVRTERDLSELLARPVDVRVAMLPMVQETESE